MVSNRVLAWATKEGDMVPINTMPDYMLLEKIHTLRRKIVAAKLATGELSLSALTLNYLEDEARERELIAVETLELWPNSQDPSR